MDDDPATTAEPHPLANRGKRKNKYHRSLLLWAMQDDDLRSGRAVSDATAFPEATIRSWKRKYDWQARVDAVGPTVQAEAIGRYRQTYMAKWGQREMHRIERNMSVPILPQDVMPKVGAGPAEQEQNRRELENPRTGSLVERLLGVTKHVIKRTTDQMRDEKWKGVPPRELPKWLKLAIDLEDMQRPVVVSGGTEVVDTARVRLARAEKTDLIEAMHEDALELVAVLGALRAKDEAPKGQVVAFPGAESAS